MKTPGRSAVCLSVSIVILAVLGLAGCGRAPQQQEDPAFWNELRSRRDLAGKRYPGTNEPSAPARLVWDLSAAKKVEYRYDQELVVAGRLTGSAATEHHKVRRMVGVQAALTLSGGEAGAARLDLKRTALRSKPIASESGGRETLELAARFAGAAGASMTPQGRVSGPAGEWLLDLLLALPGRPLTVGGRADAPVRLTFNLIGAPLDISGTCKTTLTGYVRIDNRVCARLETRLDTSRAAAGQEGEPTCAAKGLRVAYFDLHDGSLVSAHLVVLMGETALDERQGKKVTMTAFATLERMPKAKPVETR